MGTGWSELWVMEEGTIRMEVEALTFAWRVLPLPAGNEGKWG